MLTYHHSTSHRIFAKHVAYEEMCHASLVVGPGLTSSTHDGQLQKTSKKQLEGIGEPSGGVGRVLEEMRGKYENEDLVKMVSYALGDLALVSEPLPRQDRSLNGLLVAWFPFLLEPRRYLVPGRVLLAQERHLLHAAPIQVLRMYRHGTNGRFVIDVPFRTLVHVPIPVG